MKDYFYKLADFMIALATKDEVILCSLEGEESDFARLNHAKVRQAGNVYQAYLKIELINGQKSAGKTVTLSGDEGNDKFHAKSILKELRELLPVLPEDPHILYSTEINSSEIIAENKLPAKEKVLEEISINSGNNDLVGIYASGKIMIGFANSLGQKNWFEKYNFNFDFSFYYQDDKAVKSAYAGFDWDSQLFKAKMDKASHELELMKKEPKTVKPGKYNVYLAPSALAEFMHMLNWGGFSMKDHKTKSTCLLKMIEDGRQMHPSVTMKENTKEGIGANFQLKGFIKPDSVTLIENGKYKNCMISPRSAKEYGATTNGASGGEGTQSFEITPGTIDSNDILKQLDTGVYINNAWYLNFSDHSACRITGMTRFASFWVENGQIVAPLNVMRFDESIYNILGDNLIGLTKEREYMLDPDTYYKRSTSSANLPGALVKDFAFTL